MSTAAPIAEAVQTPAAPPVDPGSLPSDVQDHAYLEAGEAAFAEALAAQEAAQPAEEAVAEEAPAKESPRPEEEKKEPPAAAADPAKATEDARTAARFALLTKQEQKLVKARADLEAATKEHSAKLADAERLIAISERLKAHDISALEELGVSYEKLTESFLKAPRRDPKTIQLEREIQSLKSQQEAAAKAAQEAQQKAAYDKSIAYVAQVVTTAPDDFELTRAEGDAGIETIAQVIKAHHADTGEVMPVIEAARLVETHFEQRAEALAKLKKIQRLAAKYGEAPKPAEAQPPRQASEGEPESTDGPRTLSRNHAPVAARNLDRPKTDDDYTAAFLQELKRGG